MAVAFGTFVATELHVVPPSRLTSMFTVCDVPRLWFQVIDCVLPVVQVTAVFGAVTVIVPLEIVKLTSLVSLTVGFAEALTRTRACVVAGPETTQLYVPVVAVAFATFVATEVHVVPPSRLTSMFTVCDVPRLWFQVMDCVLPSDQVTAVFGAVTVIQSAIVKFVALVLVTAGLPERVTRTRAWVVAGPVTVQVKLPVVALVVTKPGLMVVQLAPPSRLRSMTTVAPVPRLWLKVMAWAVAMLQVTAVFGAVRVSDGVPDDDREVGGGGRRAGLPGGVTSRHADPPLRRGGARGSTRCSSAPCREGRCTRRRR